MPFWKTISEVLWLLLPPIKRISPLGLIQLEWKDRLYKRLSVRVIHLPDRNCKQFFELLSPKSSPSYRVGDGIFFDVTFFYIWGCIIWESIDFVCIILDIGRFLTLFASNLRHGFFTLNLRILRQIGLRTIKFRVDFNPTSQRLSNASQVREGHFLPTF